MLQIIMYYSSIIKLIIKTKKYYTLVLKVLNEKDQELIYDFRITIKLVSILILQSGLSSLQRYINRIPYYIEGIPYYIINNTHYNTIILAYIKTIPHYNHLVLDYKIAIPRYINVIPAYIGYATARWINFKVYLSKIRANTGIPESYQNGLFAFLSLIKGSIYVEGAFFEHIDVLSRISPRLFTDELSIINQ